MSTLEEAYELVVQLRQSVKDLTAENSRVFKAIPRVLTKEEKNTFTEEKINEANIFRELAVAAHIMSKEKMHAAEAAKKEAWDTYQELKANAEEAPETPAKSKKSSSTPPLAPKKGVGRPKKLAI